LKVLNFIDEYRSWNSRKSNFLGMNNTLIQSRDGARGGLGDYIPRGSMLAPLSEGEKLCFQRLLAFIVP